MTVRTVLTLEMCFLWKAAGAAVLQPGSWRFKSLRFAMSLGKASCLQSLNPLKTSSFHLQAYTLYFCLLFQEFYMGNWGLRFVRPNPEKSTWDWQTNKQTAIKITKPVGRHRDGQTVSQRHTYDHSVLFLLSRKTLRERWDRPHAPEKLTHCGGTRRLDSGRSGICFQTEPAQFTLFTIHLFEIRYSWHTLWSFFFFVLSAYITLSTS